MRRITSPPLRRVHDPFFFCYYYGVNRSFITISLSLGLSFSSSYAFSQAMSLKQALIQSAKDKKTASATFQKSNQRDDSQWGLKIAQEFLSNPLKSKKVGSSKEKKSQREISGKQKEELDLDEND